MQGTSPAPSTPHRQKESGYHFERSNTRLAGDPGEARTHDPVIKSHLLYQLSYRVIPISAVFLALVSDGF